MKFLRRASYDLCVILSRGRRIFSREMSFASTAVRKKALHRVYPECCRRVQGDRYANSCASHSRRNRAFIPILCCLIVTLTSPLVLGQERTPTGVGAGSESDRTVEVIRPTIQTIQRDIEVPIEVLPYQQVSLFAKVSGYLDRIGYDIGDEVEAGERIAVLKLPELESQRARELAEVDLRRAEYTVAEARSKVDKLLYERLIKVLSESPDMVSQEQVDEAAQKSAVSEAQLAVLQNRIKVAQAKVRETEQMIAYGKIDAPFSGIITYRYVDPGALIQAATSGANVTPIVDLVDISKLRLRGHIPAPESPYLDIGDRVVITISELPSEVIEGRVSRHSWALQRGSRKLLAEVMVDNSDRRLRPGMMGKAIFFLEEIPQAILLPSEAVGTGEESRFVYVVKDHVINRTPVVLAMDDGIMAQVVEGLQGDELVLASAQVGVNEGERVRERVISGE